MDYWSNIEASANDPELLKIDAFEAQLGGIPDGVYKIRELITRFEICHFKYQKHLQKIKESILKLEPLVTPDTIGRYHIQHGETVWEKDSTGKSLLGQQYVWAIKHWLGHITSKNLPKQSDKKLVKQVANYLGVKDEMKIRLVRLLLARLTWDWKLYEEMKQDDKYKDLEFQVCRMDICHYAFPGNFDNLLRAVGKLQALDNFEGCGTCNAFIKEFVEQELQVLNGLLKSFTNKNLTDKKSWTQGWLFACLVKTLKEQTGLSEPVIEI
ncbi:hypothetical protein OU798_06650 [Prolixibacteraceae bacterium Z1-6]|uniref:Uncharacterized protein n=1 Tax=Draconibacterium aestuarii TaxID=2998507 RepID=A0A9X3J438_9BACT|nr:hypothetical protein [Prolixibacteraceae bacterium Z1-6]